MQIPELVYNFLSAKDVTDGSLQIVERDYANADAATTVDITALEVPGDKVFVLSNALLLVNPGSGQVARMGNVKAQLDPGSGHHIFDYGPTVENTTADVQLNLDFSHHIWLPPGSQMLASGYFDAGVQNNNVNLYISGFYIPRGNIQQG